MGTGFLYSQYVSGASDFPKFTSYSRIKEEAKPAEKWRKIQKETTEMVPLWQGTFLILSHFNRPSWHPGGKVLSSDLLFPQEEQDFVAISKSEAAVSQKGSFPRGTRESQARSHWCLWD